PSVVSTISQPGGGESAAASSMSPKAPGVVASGRKWRAIRRSSADSGDFAIARSRSGIVLVFYQCRECLGNEASRPSFAEDRRRPIPLRKTDRHKESVQKS